MTVYARSDVVSVALSKDHGGCGAVHSRPVTHGAPVMVWALDCHQCADHLRSDPLWVTDTEEIPETPDEQKARERREEKGEKGIARNLEAALVSLASSQEGMQTILTVLTAALAGSNPDVTKALAALAPTPVTLSDDTLHTIADVAVPVDVSVNDVPAEVNRERAKLGLQPIMFKDLDTMKLPELRTLTKDRGLDSTGTREQLIARLRG